ncbi:MAG: VOC family protein [Lachnospiraceae bacterium]|nr:VOC family protein [Lachnospiraceae bacterium]
MGTKNIGVKTIAHLAFNIKNTEKMLTFYTEILGIKQFFTQTFGELLDNMGMPSDYMADRRDDPWSTYLMLSENTFIEFFYDTGKIQDFPYKLDDCCGYHSVTLGVGNLDDLRYKLMSHEIFIKKDVKNPQLIHEISVLDPDGNTINFIEVPNLENDNPQIILAHQLQVVNAKEMIDFYCQGLGLETVYASSHELNKQYIKIKHNQIILLICPDNDSLIQIDDLKEYYGYQHFCLEVEDINQAWDAVVANGITPDTPIKKGVDGSMQFWVVDPDGNRIELMQYTEDSKQITCQK